jgi:hypothetical protein
MFQIIRCLLDENGRIVARWPLHPQYELWEDANAVAEFDSSRIDGDYGYDEERQCWWATDAGGRRYRFVVELAAAEHVAA